MCSHQPSFVPPLLSMYTLLNILQVLEVSDRYVVSGDAYITVREAFTKVVLGESVEHLETVVQVSVCILV